MYLSHENIIKVQEDSNGNTHVWYLNGDCQVVRMKLKDFQKCSQGRGIDWHDRYMETSHERESAK